MDMFASTNVWLSTVSLLQEIEQMFHVKHLHSAHAAPSSGNKMCDKRHRDIGIAREGEPMDFKQLIKDRYSCKKYSDVKPTEEELQAVLEAGRLAPTAKNLQEHHIYVLESPEALAKFDSVTPCRYGAPMVLVVAYDTTNVFTYPGGKYQSGIEDASIVATHLMLAAKDEGLDSCWINFLDPEKLANELGLPHNETVLMALDLGHAAEGVGPLANHTSRKPLQETVTRL